MKVMNDLNPPAGCHIWIEIVGLWENAVISQDVVGLEGFAQRISRAGHLTANMKIGKPDLAQRLGRRTGGRRRAGAIVRGGRIALGAVLVRAFEILAPLLPVCTPFHKSAKFR
jgi:hypothetical protein